MTAATPVSGLLLRTLPGWPTEIDPDTLTVLLLCLLGPLALGALIAFIAFARRLTRPDEVNGQAHNLVVTEDQERAEIARLQALTSLGQAMLAEDPAPGLPDAPGAH